MAPMRDGSLPVLPIDVARNIVERLGCRDMCSAIAACRSFHSWGNACTCIYASLSTPQSVDSLLRFLGSRSSSGLEACLRIGPAPRLCTAFVRLRGE